MRVRLTNFAQGYGGSTKAFSCGGKPDTTDRLREGRTTSRTDG